MAFVAAKSARDPARWSNCRSEAAWLLREALQARKMPIPDDANLHEELLAMTWALAPDCRIMLDPKDDIRAILKKSPDMADSLMLLAWHLRLTDRAAHGLTAAEQEGFAAIADLWRPSPWGEFADHR